MTKLPQTATEYCAQPHIVAHLKKLEELARIRADEKNAPIEEELHL